MAKPTHIPTWDTDLTNATEPTSGLKSDGYATDDVPTSANINWLFAYIYLWLKWIDDGIWTAVSLALSSDLTLNSPALFHVNTDATGPSAANEISGRAIRNSIVSMQLNNTVSPTVVANDSYAPGSVAASATEITITHPLVADSATHFLKTGCLLNVTVSLGDETGL